MSDKDFITELKNNIIPWLENIIAKEKAHNEWLTTQGKSNLKVEYIEMLIESSNEKLKHFELRLEEYRLYVENNSNNIE